MNLLRVSYLAVALLCSSVYAQSPDATVAGRVVDPASAVVAGARVEAISLATRIRRTGQTNKEGAFLIPNLPPGPYRIQVAKDGFKTVIREDVVLRVQDVVALNFTLQVGSVTETITVQGGAPLVNTEDAAVSTVVDQNFVQNIPLNGRSFQTLITLTPGVVLTPASYVDQGQFSVNGQRPDSNYFTVDGVSANFNVNAGAGLGQSASGSLPGLSSSGGTNSLVSVDAMQEFRIQTSTFAPEFGRMPGAQVSIVTRSGTNQWHGTAFDYFRNDVLDANDWFAGRNSLPKPKERQNDFGGVLGGPIAKDRSFFFFSYEGLRLRQPQTQETVVPDIPTRQATPANIQPYLNAYPVPNGSQLAGGFAEFNGSFSNPSTLDAYSLRLDHTLNSHWELFGRWAYSHSQTITRGNPNPLFSVLSNTATAPYWTDTLTLGFRQTISNTIDNETRANYSNAKAGQTTNLDRFGGAVPVPDTTLFTPGLSSSTGNVYFSPGGAGAAWSVGKLDMNEQRQLNLVDNLSVSEGVHRLRFGIDYRWLAPINGPAPYSQSAYFNDLQGPDGVLSGRASEVDLEALVTNSLLYQNLSLYGQDTWNATSRLSLTYGLRWDLNPALRGKNSRSQLYTVEGVGDPPTMTLAPKGTPIYNTTYGDVAPRIGFAYLLHQNKGRATIVRGGFGIFYDLASGIALGNVGSGYPFLGLNSLFDTPFPLTPQQASPPALSLSPPIPLIYAAVPDLKLPRTYQWNAALEQSLGANQSVSLTYVGAGGRDLLREQLLVSPNTTFSNVYVTDNRSTSHYNALQAKFQRRLSRGVQVLGSYTWSHSIDTASSDSSYFSATPASISSDPNADRGNSSFDVRHSFTAAAGYDIPTFGHCKSSRALLGGWSLDTFIVARSATPVDLIGSYSIVAARLFTTRPDVVSGQPLYLFGSELPGGKALNPAAFAAPPSGLQGNLGRNTLRGFAAWQDDFAMRRQFHFTENLGLQFRAEFFNIFNHPNFGPAHNAIYDPLFGESTQMLGTSLGTGGLNGGFNPLYQVGGPRSIQLALKLQF